MGVEKGEKYVLKAYFIKTIEKHFHMYRKRFLPRYKRLTDRDNQKRNLSMAY